MPGNFASVPQSLIDSWPEPNYVDPVRRSWMPAFASTWQVASTLLLAGRFYLRARKQAGSFGLDDLMIFIGWAFSVPFTATAILASTKYQMDRHTWDVHTSLYVETALNGWLAQVLFIFSIVSTKISVLLFYRRMTKESVDRKWLYAIYFALFLTISYGIAVFLTYVLMCEPLEAYWRAYDLDYKVSYTCIDGNAQVLTSGAMNALSDVYAVALPCLMLRNFQLRISRRQKIALNLVFGLGFLVTGASIARTYYLWRLSHTYDTSWTGFTVFVWSQIELQGAIICASAPSLRAFFRRYLKSHLKRTMGSASAVSYHGRTFNGSGDSRLEKGGNVVASGGTESTQELNAGPPEEVELEQRKIRSPSEYEQYVLAPLSRQASFRSSNLFDAAARRSVPNDVGDSPQLSPC